MGKSFCFFFSKKKCFLSAYGSEEDVIPRSLARMRELLA